MKKHKILIGHFKLIFLENWAITICVVVLIIPFIGVEIANLIWGKNIVGNPDFWYGYMAYFGTVVLAGVSLFQTQRSILMSKKFDNMNAMQNYSFARATKKCNITIKDNVNASLSGYEHYKSDAGAIAVRCKEHQNSDMNSDEYMFEFFFKDYSKATIFEIQLEQIECLRVPCRDSIFVSESGQRLKNIDLPITTQFQRLSSKKLFPTWVSNETFKFLLKIYSVHGGVFSDIIENKTMFIMIIHVILTSACGIDTKMRYKFFFEITDIGIELVSSETQMINVSLQSDDTII